jgi:hypothetical protein
MNRSAPLSDCTTAEQCAVIQIFWSEGVKPSKIQRRMLAQYRKNYHAKEGVPMSEKVPKWQNKHC